MKLQFAAVLLLVSCAEGQSTRTDSVEVRDVNLALQGGSLQVEVLVSAPVHPSLRTATSPTRMVLDLPNTSVGTKWQHLRVNVQGVRAVRVGMHTLNPPSTRVVIDLDRPQPCALRWDGNKMILTLTPPAGSGAQREAPPAAASGKLPGIFHRRPENQLPAVGASSLSPIPPFSAGSAHPLSLSKQRVETAAAMATGNGSSSASVSPPPDQTAEAHKPIKEDSAGPTRAVASQRSAPGSISPQRLAGQPAIGEAIPVSQTPIRGATASTGSEGDDASQPPAKPAGTAASPQVSDSATALQALDPSLRTVFKVKYVVEGVAYLDGGRSSGLAESMKLEIKDTALPAQRGATADPKDPRVVAELEVTAIAETSAATDVHGAKRPVKPGDLAYLSSDDSQALVQQRTLSATRQYPVVVAFSAGDPLDEEVRAEIPRPPSPAVNRASGRIGFDYLGTVSHGTAGLTSSNLGLVLRADITRINGTYWNLTGYWRGRLTSQSSSTQPTLQDLINRTYHLGMFYDNPNSPWVAGFGRLYLPWAPSLETIDGGYFGRRLPRGMTAGIFGGSTPDPTSWDFNIDRRIAGAFINFEGGSYDAFHYTSTSGLGVSAVKWQIDRPFVFFDNSLSYKRYVSIYDSLQGDSPRGNPVVPAPGPGISRNFFTIRWQAHPRVELDFNQTFFRDIPTFDPALIGTGLLDKYLFQGFSAGARIEVAKQIFVYADLGRSNRTGDTKKSLNQLYGVTFGRLPWLGLRADVHYSRFNSSFADGSYRSLSLSKNLNDNMRLELLLGDQNFISTLTSNNRTRFATTNFETSLGPHYFLQGGFTINRGQSLNYDQWMFTLGYRFDSRRKHQ
jgi:AMIN domain